MKVSYYTIDDLRMGHDPRGVNGWRMNHYLRLDWALARYRDMSPAGVKALGVTDGIHVLELVRCQPIFSDDTEGEDMLASDYRDFPLWRDVPEVAEAAAVCAEQLNIRYRIQNAAIIPVPPAKGFPKALKGKYLWGDRPGDPASALRWVYVAGRGWIQPSELDRCRADTGRGFSLPLVLKYQADGVTETGEYTALEVTPWEFEQLVLRTKERIDQNKSRRNAS